MSYHCNVCYKSFSHETNLYRHKRSAHGLSRSSTSMKNEYICEHCHFKCAIKTELVGHLRKNHVQNHKGSKLKCPKCDTYVIRYELLDQHLSYVHEIEIQEEYLEFKNEGEFRFWKANLEKETSTQYRAERGLRQRTSYTQREFICNRSYDAVYLKKDRKRAFKSLGTNKIGSTCPSRMIVKFFAETVTVNFVRIHVGHSAEVIRMRIPSQQRAEIAGKLKVGVTLQRVLDDIRESGDRENFQRIHYMQKKDVRNIIRDYNIGYLMRFHDDDVISVEILVETLRKLEDSPMLHYNSDYENFCLILMTHFQKCMLLQHSEKICVDGTHGLNSYGYQMVSILVIDEFNNGVPVAFCFTKKTDFDAMHLFFTKVKDAVGYSIESKIFMSDDAPQFFDAWTAVMGRPENRLLSWWHVNKNWTAMLNTKIADQAKRKYVRHTLYSLATSTAVDINEFESQLTVFLNSLRDDEDTRAFYEYLKSHYLPKRSAWAFCHRKHLGLNVNMHIESMHKKLKYHYLDGKRCVRLDKSIDAVLKMVRDDMYERVIKIAKELPSNKVLKIRSAHVKRREIPDEDVVCVMESEVWHVKSQTRKELTYEIKKVSENCLNVNLCVLRCSECDVCIHKFKCSCVDNVIYLNVCKHIHKVAEKLRSSDVVDEKLQDNSKKEIEVSATLATLDSHPKLKYDNKENDEDSEDNELQAKLGILMQMFKNLPREQKQTLSKTLDKFITSVDRQHDGNSISTIRVLSHQVDS